MIMIIFMLEKLRLISYWETTGHLKCKLGDYRSSQMQCALNISVISRKPEVYPKISQR